MNTFGIVSLVKILWVLLYIILIIGAVFVTVVVLMDVWHRLPDAPAPQRIEFTSRAADMFAPGQTWSFDLQDEHEHCQASLTTDQIRRLDRDSLQSLLVFMAFEQTMPNRSQADSLLVAKTLLPGLFEGKCIPLEVTP